MLEVAYACIYPLSSRNKVASTIQKQLTPATPKTIQCVIKGVVELKSREIHKKISF